MTSPKLFKALIALEISLALASVISHFILQSYLPQMLQSYLQSLDNVVFTLIDGLVFCFGLILILGYFVAWIGMWRFWKPARMLYLIVWIIGILSLPFSGPSVSPGLSYMFGSASTFVAGSILSLAFFSSITTRFEEQSRIVEK